MGVESFAMKHAWIFLFLLVPLPSFASLTNGNDLLEKCKDVFSESALTVAPTVTESMNAGYCIGYFAGVTETETFWSEVEPAGKIKHYCFPEGVTQGEVYRIVKKWLDSNPDKLHFAAETIIHNALVSSFPCK